MNGKQIEMKYQGPIQGFFAVTSPLSGVRYEIQGRGDQFMVYEDDAVWLETTFQRYGQEYIRVMRTPASAPIILPVIDFSTLPTESSIPDITAMAPREAVKAIMALDNEADLRVVEALENGTERRPKVLEAVARRRLELAP